MIRVAACAVVLAVCVNAHAGQCLVAVPATVQTVAGAVTITPFAVPVAVPVTTIQPGSVGYSYTAAASAYRVVPEWRTPEDDLADRIAARLAERIGTLGTLAARPAAATLTTKHCAACHTGEGAKGGFRVDQPLDDAARLAAIEAVLHDDEAHRMPKGKTLAPEDLGPLIQELSRRPPAATSRQPAGNQPATEKPENGR